MRPRTSRRHDRLRQQAGTDVLRDWATRGQWAGPFKDHLELHLSGTLAEFDLDEVGLSKALGGNSPAFMSVILEDLVTRSFASDASGTDEAGVGEKANYPESIRQKLDAEPDPAVRRSVDTLLEPMALDRELPRTVTGLWLERTLALFGAASPREAALDPARHAAVVDWLTLMESRIAANPEWTGFDTTWMWRELELERFRT